MEGGALPLAAVPRKGSAANHLGKPHAKISSSGLSGSCVPGQSLKESMCTAMVLSSSSHQTVSSAEMSCILHVLFRIPQLMVLYNSRHRSDSFFPHTRHLATTLGRSRKLLSVFWPLHSTLEMESALGTFRTTGFILQEYRDTHPAARSARPTQSAGVFINLFPTCFSPGPAHLQSSHSGCQKHGAEKSSTLSSRYVYCSSRCRERKEGKYISSYVVVEM